MPLELISKSIYSLGSSTRTWEEFLAILVKFGIELLVDVRSFPTSKYEHFKRENLEDTLKKAGFQYAYLGRELGGYRKGGYEAYTKTSSFLKGLDLLEEKALKKKAVFMCAERLPWRCHRRFIAAELEHRGWRVIHIINAKRTWEPDPNFYLSLRPSKR